MRFGPIAAAGLITWLLMMSFGQRAKTPEEQLGAAIHLHDAEGNLEGAIAEYQNFLKAFPAHRALAAKAQLRLADCYRQLGRPEARNAYERVVTLYPDQREMVALAQARLAALRPAPSGVFNRRLFAFNHYGYFGAVSPDERLLTYFELSTRRRGLVLRELATGRERLLSERGFVGRTTAFSPDSTVVSFQSFAGVVPQLRLVNIDGTQERVLFESPELLTLVVHDWSSDGKQILVTLVKRDRTRQLVAVAFPGGGVRILKTFDQQVDAVARFSPDARLVAYSLRGPGSAAWEVHLLAADGAAETVVAPHPARDLLVGWARDGRLVFASERRGRAELWVARVADGKAAAAPEPISRQIPEFASVLGMNSMMLTRSGSLHHTSFRQQDDAYLVELDPSLGTPRGSPRLLVESAPGRSQLPAFSPDGSRVAVLTMERGTWTLAVVATNGLQVERQIPVPALRSAFHLRWTQGGEKFLIDGEDTSQRRGLYQIEPDGKMTLLVHLPKAGVRVAGLAPAPSDQSVLWLQGDDGLLSLKSADLATRQEAVLSAEKFDKDRWGSLSPSGLRMVLFTFDSGRVREFTIFDVTESRSRNLVASRALRMASDLVWGSDDRFVLLLAGPGDAPASAPNSLWRLSLEDGSVKLLGDLTLPGTLQPFSLHPSGGWITVGARTTIAEYWATEPLDLR